MIAIVYPDGAVSGWSPGDRAYCKPLDPSDGQEVAGPI